MTDSSHFKLPVTQGCHHPQRTVPGVSGQSSLLQRTLWVNLDTCNIAFFTAPFKIQTERQNFTATLQCIKSRKPPQAEYDNSFLLKAMLDALSKNGLFTSTYFFYLPKKLHGSMKNLPHRLGGPSYCAGQWQPTESCASSEPTKGELLCTPGLASGKSVSRSWQTNMTGITSASQSQGHFLPITGTEMCWRPGQCILPAQGTACSTASR